MTTFYFEGVIEISKFYSLEELDKIENVQYHIIFGERSNGKSYALGKRVLDNYFKYGEEFVICKRYEEDIKTKICSTMLEPLYDYILDTYGYRIKFYQGRWLCYEDGAEGKLTECKVIGYALSISASDRIKGSQYPRVTTIVFEEFMSQSAMYLNDEVNLFLNVVSTIVRYRTNVKIYMLGNAISKHSPYAESLDIRLHRMKHGEIIVKEYVDKKGRRTKFAIQRTANVDVFDSEENVNNIVYNVFGNSGVGKMITTGEFETHSYNKVVNNITFYENIKHLPKSKYIIVGKEHRLPIVIKYEDYYYRLYMINDINTTFAFREIKESEINSKNTKYILNNNKHFKGIANIVNLMTYNCFEKKIDDILNELVQAYKQNNLLFINDDNGEDIHNALTLVGLS